MVERLRVDDKPACAGANPEYFFPKVLRNNKPRHYKPNWEIVINAVKALELCSICPIRQKCLDFAFKSIETAQNGIYGGTLDTERKQAMGLSVTVSYKKLEFDIRNEANKRWIPNYEIPKVNREDINSCINLNIN